MIGRETIKLESKVDHLKRRGAEHRVSQIKTTCGHLGGDRLCGAKGSATARSAPLLNDAGCETRLGRGEKIARQLPLTASVGSRRVTLLTYSRPGHLSRHG
jgi:hypothetical protein